MPGPAPDRLDHAANLFGALALAITDRMFDAVEETGESGTTAVALSALHQFLDRPTVDLLRRVLGLTSSGAVRLVDRLESAGWVEREDAADGRATAVHLTPAGRRIARRISASRTSTLKQALSTTLSTAEIRDFEHLVSRVLVGLKRGPGAVRWLCRFCDMDACGWSDGHCPLRNATRELSG
jgi:DNA-binding MarR family transcriptional regulator